MDRGRAPGDRCPLIGGNGGAGGKSGFTYASFDAGSGGILLGQLSRWLVSRNPFPLAALPSLQSTRGPSNSSRTQVTLTGGAQVAPLRRLEPRSRTAPQDTQAATPGVGASGRTTPAVWGWRLMSGASCLFLGADARPVPPGSGTPGRPAQLRVRSVPAPAPIPPTPCALGGAPPPGREGGQPGPGRRVAERWR